MRGAGRSQCYGGLLGGLAQAWPAVPSHQGLRLLRGAVSLASHSKEDWEWQPWGVGMKRDVGYGCCL